MSRPSFEKIPYSSLNSRQKEIYNFQKIAAVLADYGYNCIKPANGRQVVDFVAHHIDGTKLNVQLTTRVTIDKNYCGKHLWMAFPVADRWYLILHDELMKTVDDTTPALANKSWLLDGRCSWPEPPPKRLLNALKKYMV